MPDSTFTRAAVRVQAARARAPGQRIRLSIFALFALWLAAAAPAGAGTRIMPDPFWIPDNPLDLTHCVNFFTVTNQGLIPNRFMKQGFGQCSYTKVGLFFILIETDELSSCPVLHGLSPRKFGPTNAGAFYCRYLARRSCRADYKLSSRGKCVPQTGIAGDKQPSICPLQTASPVSGTSDSGNLAAGNPINLATASKYQREVDYRSAGGAFPLTFVRHYNSRAGMEAASMGPKWRHHYDRSVEINVTSGGRSAYVFRADGRVAYFNDDPLSGAWISDSDVEARFSEQTDAAGETAGFSYVTEADVVESYDPDGRLTAITSREGFTQTLDYDDGGRLVQVTGPFGRTIAFAYDPDDRLSALIDPAGAQYRYEYDAAGRLSKLIFPDETPEDPADNPFREYLYEDLAVPEALTGIVDANGDRFATWAYDGQGRAVFSEHAGGADRTAITYNTDGSVTVTDALNTSRTYQIDVVLGVAKSAGITEPCNQCAGQSSSATFDTDGYPASRTDFNSNVTTFVHDARGLEISRTEAAGTPDARTVNTEWHPVLRRPAKVTVPGRETAFTYDAAGRLLTRTVSDIATGAARMITRSYNAEGLFESIDGPRTDVADVTRFEYDAAGNLERTINALGQVTEITAHDPHGRPVLLKDPNGVPTTLQYDARHRLVSRDVAGSKTEFEYDAVGNVTRVTLPDGSFIAQEYDAAHRLIAMSDNLGNRTAYTLDALGNRTAERIFDPLGALTRTRSRVYDHLNRLTDEIGGEGQITRFAYDPQGNLITGTDPNGEPTTSSYDPLNRLVATLAPDDGVTGFAYDARDNLTEVTDPRGLTTVFTYNGFDEVVETSSPDTGLTVQTYDEAGNRLTSTDARDITAEFEYDVLNRLTAIRYPDRDENVGFTYDEGLNGIGRLTRIDDEAGTIAIAYDARGNLVNEIRTIDGIEFETRYDYDPADRLMQMTYPSGLVVDYHRDALGRVAEVSAVIDGEPRTVASGLEYAPFGPMTGLTYGNGIQMTRALDGDYRLVRQVAGTVQDLGFQYDPAGNILAIADGTDPARDQIFGYDPVNRLTAAEGVYGTRAYTYDRVGNRLSRTADGAIDDYSYSPTANQLVSIDGPNAQDFIYNAAGNTVQKGPQAFIYNDANRLASVQNSSELVAAYTYNAKGERVKKSVVGAETTIFHYDSAGNLLAEFAGDGDHQRDYLWLEGERLAIVAPDTGPDFSFSGADRRTGESLSVGVHLEDQALEIQGPDGLSNRYELSGKQWRLNNRGLLRILYIEDGVLIAGVLHTERLKGFLVARTTAGWGAYRLVGQSGGSGLEGLFFIHADHLGTPKAITDETLEVVWQAEYTPFGSVLVNLEKIKDNFRFSGQYFDAELDLINNGLRAYDSGVGRYTKSDPIGFGGGANTYIYALANPVNITDSSGMDPKPKINIHPVITALEATCEVLTEGVTKIREGFEKDIDGLRTTNLEIAKNNFEIRQRNCLIAFGGPDFVSEAVFGFGDRNECKFKKCIEDANKRFNERIREIFATDQNLLKNLPWKNLPPCPSSPFTSSNRKK